MSLAELNYIEQEDEKGCGLACIAMLTFNSYKDVKDAYSLLFKKDINTDGIYLDEELTLFSYFGYREAIICYSGIYSLHPERTFLLCAPSLNYPGTIHRIIIQTPKDINIPVKVYDPSPNKKYTDIPTIWFDVIEIVHGESNE